ncbi:MAG: DUF393 domain-containing protein [Leptolyngbya sp. SIO1D8]|nr:DUF393 domain-containing protein [Leptolyngbya sp. SIO1D8]
MAYLSRTFSLQLKSLALFRIGLACVIGLALFPINANAAIFEPELSDSWLFQSLPFLPIGSINAFPPVIFLLIGLLVFFNLRLLTGYQTRLTTFLCFCLCGLAYLWDVGHFRLLGEALLPILFWAIFLPLGAQYSLDSAMNPEVELLPRSVLSSATIALLIQQCFNYWLSERSAIFPWLTLSPMGNSSALSYSVLMAGILAPFLLLVTDKRGIFRCLAITLCSLGHIVAVLFWGQGIIPALFAISTWLTFLPESVWRYFEQRIDHPARRGLTIYYDVDCGFCKKVVHVLRTLLILPGTPLLTAQSDDSICADMEAYNSWVVVDWQQKRHYKFEAIAYICGLSPGLNAISPLLRWAPVMAAGTRFYEMIANNRKRAGLFTRFLKFKPDWLKRPAFENFALGVLIATYGAVNFSRVIRVFSRTIAIIIRWISIIS